MFGQKEKKPPRFKTILEEEDRSWHRIVQDLETGVLYYVTGSNSNGVGVTVMVDADGKPLIGQPDIEDVDTDEEKFWEEWQKKNE